MLDKPQPPHAREFTGQFMRVDVVPKLAALHTLTGGIDAFGAIQAINGLVKASLDFTGYAVSAALKGGAGLFVDAAIQPVAANSREAQAAHE